MPKKKKMYVFLCVCMIIAMVTSFMSTYAVFSYVIINSCIIATSIFCGPLFPLSFRRVKRGGGGANKLICSPDKE